MTGAECYIDLSPRPAEVDTGALDAWLDTEIELKPENPAPHLAHAGIVLSALRRYDIMTVRDVLVVGGQGVANIPIASRLGGASLSRIARMAATSGPYPLRWLQRPRIIDIANLTLEGGLSAVPSYVLQDRDDLIGDKAHRFAGKWSILPPTVQHVLDGDVGRLSENFPPDTRERVQRLSRESAVAFAPIYNLARQALMEAAT